MYVMLIIHGFIFLCLDMGDDCFAYCVKVQYYLDHFDKTSIDVLRKVPKCIDAELNELRASCCVQGSAVNLLSRLKREFMERLLQREAKIHVRVQGRKMKRSKFHGRVPYARERLNGNDDFLPLNDISNVYHLMETPLLTDDEMFVNDFAVEE